MKTTFYGRAFGAATLALLAGPGAAQVTFEVITPSGQFNQAIGISDDGEFVCGTGGTNGFIWSASGGLQTGFGFPVEAWAVVDGGQAMTGVFLNALGQNEAGVWTASGGTQLAGNLFGASGCGSDLSSLFDVSSDGTTGVGMSWQGCQTTPMRWRQGVGLTALAKQNASSSARASRVSGNGLVSVGWDQGLPTGPGFSRRACVWTDDVTQVFPLTSPSNSQGLGEITCVNSDGTVYGGSSASTAFRVTPANGLEFLPPLAGVPGQYFVNAISEDGSIAVGVRLQFPTAEAVLWLPSGPVRAVDFLAANGIAVNATDVRNATGVSADGTVICGWGNVGAWVLTLADPAIDVYCTPKTSSAGCVTTISTSDPSSQPASGAADYFVTASAVQGAKTGLLFGGVTGPAAIPFSGGTLCVTPPLERGPLQNGGGTSPTSCDGAFAQIVNGGDILPDGLDAGAGNSAWYQWWYRDPLNGGGTFGTALSNAVQLDFQ